jgi:hypothetical protein
MEHTTVETEWYLVESDEPEDREIYVEPQGMVETALNELGAVIVAIDLELPEPA